MHAINLIHGLDKLKRREAARARYLADPEKYRERSRRYAVENPSTRAATVAASLERHSEKRHAEARATADRLRRENPDLKRKRDRESYARHSAERIAAAVVYQRDHPEHRSRYKARKKGAAVVERFSHEEIAERDGWTCHICEEPVTRERWSIDHLVPLSFGGEHTRANVKLAHHSCNASRGNRDLSYLKAA